MASIFTQIINGDIPCNRIYEDDTTIAFLDIHPLVEGHTLVVPKNEVVSFDSLEESEFLQLMASVHKVARRIKEVYDPMRVVQFTLGFDVEHAHVHVLPINSFEEFKTAITEHGNAGAVPNFENLDAVQQKLTLM